MRRSLAIALALATLATSFPGCGGQSIPQVGTNMAPPHGGALFSLDGGRGMVEFLNEVKGEGRPADSRLVVYFLSPDGVASLAPAPTDVSATLISTGRPKAVKLVAEPQADDARGAARFASAVGRYGDSEVEGVLEATVGGERSKIQFLVR
ncbi:hypothetical protein TA3x_003705 [Tundrisphaera sp. TA3]|uniref:hypothetical protein n=1 Tax=Tundrisphaera sp. TA3 TaxID=3435775 RepID=UPI003EC0E7A8